MNLIVAALIAFAAASDISGTWKMGLQGGHVIPVALVLKQDGTALTGTITIPISQTDRIDVPLTGEIADGALKLAGTVEQEKDGRKEKSALTMEGRVLDDGTLEGHMDFQGHHMHMPWTAERFKERKQQ
jgi:hypothetical protein